MKKKIALITALCTIMAVPVSAGTLNKDTTSGTMDLSYTQESAYTVTIPDSIVFASPKEVKTASVSADGVIIDHGTTLKVTVTGQNYDSGWKLADTKSGGDKLDYTFKAANAAVSNGDSILEVAAGTATGNTALEFTGPEAAKKSGVYKDTLTFNVSVA